MRHAPMVLLAACAALAACSSGSDITPTPAQLLYVGDDALPAFLRVYTLPLSATSLPTVVLPLNKPFLIGASSNTLAVTELAGNIRLFTLPVSDNSGPFATISSPSNSTPVFSHGLLYQGATGNISVYTPPFSSATAASDSIATFGLSTADLTVDPNGNLYLTTGANVIGVVSNSTLTTVLTAPATMSFRGLAATTTRLIACGFNGLANNVFIYALPLSPTATPVATIDLGDAAPEACVLDTAGNLYVGSPDGRIFVFAPPFSSTSVPTVTVTTPAVIFGMAIGE